MTPDVNLSSARARKARLSIKLDKSALRLMLKIILGVGLVLWAYGILILHLAAAHLLLIVISAVLMPLLWYSGELKNLPTVGPLTSSAKIEDVLDRQILGQLRGSVTFAQLLSVVAKLPGGAFYANRYAISSDALSRLLPGNMSTSIAWERCLELAIQTGDTSINSAHIIVALLLLVPEYDYYLAQLNVTKDDIISGLGWYRHIENVFTAVATKKPAGGLGRDLSFGWAPLLNRLGVNISEQVGGGVLHREVEGHEETLAQVSHLLSQSGRRNAALVGEVGVGKTTLVYALAERLMNAPTSMSPELRYRQVIELDASSLISQAKGRGELESLLIRLFNEAFHAKNIIIFLDEAQLFLQDGVGSVDLSSVLLPVLQAGGLQIIVALSDQEWLKLTQNSPGLSQLMNRVVISPLNQEDTVRVMEDQVLLMEGRSSIIYMHQALTEAYKLADRYIRDQAFPGKAIRLLEAAAGFSEEKYFISAKSVQQAVEKNFDVKVQTASTADERNVLLNLEGRIHERMINQTHAVQVVSDALRRARAGVSNQNKPIGTFLFLGPTGVGKTELAKALAAVYFNGEDRLVRVDLNEYSESADVSRLLAIGAENTHSLTAQIAKQPFSVVLLDEIEKAHPNVLNVLLQMLDEGMLRDTQNKPVSFRDAIIIATSNAGADKIREHIAAGESLEQFEDDFIDELISSNIFRPEFINRFDETVLFRPLSQEELEQVVDLIVGSINKTLAAQKISVNLTKAAKQLLAEKGYDPRLGARPLRRVTQRSIENIVAQKLLSQSVVPGATIELDAPELLAALDVRKN